MIRKRSGSAPRTAWTCSAVHGITRWSSIFGFFTDPALQGFLVIRSSSTAADRIVETLLRIRLRYAGEAPVPSRPRSHAWIVLGLIWARVIEPSVG